MGEPALFDLPPAFVKVDGTRGHITLAANPFGQCDGAFVDLGCELHWWANTPLHLDSAGARLLGEALVAWADRKAARDVDAGDVDQHWAGPTRGFMFGKAPE